MLFNSAAFLFVFLPLVWVAYSVCLRRNRLIEAKSVLLIASIAFYAVWDWRFLPLLLLSITANHGVAVWLVGSQTNRRIVLTAALTLNLAVLVYFKYWLWIGGSLAHFGLLAPDAIGNVVLPLGISFFTFHIISFLVDAYRRQTEPGSWLDSAVYFMFFPHLIAGPILTHRDFAPQLASPRPAQREWISRAIVLIVVGLAKKLLIADMLARYVVNVYWPQPGVSSVGFFDAWIAVAGYSAQLFYDFSAYCEIAVGLAMLFGYRFPINFWSPYRAETIQAFWGRWHITLGRFLRDYLYIPLGGARRGFTHGLFAVCVTFVLGGLWHGAGVTFLVWGLLHAGYVVVFRLWQLQALRLHRVLAIATTLMAVMFAWVPFRSMDMSQALVLWQGMLGLAGLALPRVFSDALPFVGSVSAASQYAGLEVFPLVALFVWMLTKPNLIEVATQQPMTRRRVVWLSALWFAVVFALALPTEFLYFQF